MTTTQPRVLAGVPAGGEFAAHLHSDKVPALAAPTVSPDFVTHRLGESGFAAYMSEDEIAEVTEELNASRDFRDENITAVADRIHLDAAGYTVSDAIAASEGMSQLTRLGREDWAAALRRVIDRTPAQRPSAPWPAHDTSGSISPELIRRTQEQPAALPDGKTVPVPLGDPRLQAGEVFDKVKVNDTVFNHSSISGYPQDTQAIRFQANRPLSDAEAYALSGFVGYANSSAIGGEPLDDPAIGPRRDTRYSFICGIDTNKGRQGNFEKFEDMLPDLIAHGSAPRVTKGNTRAIEPFGDPDLKLEIFYAE